MILTTPHPYHKTQTMGSPAANAVARRVLAEVGPAQLSTRMWPNSAHHMAAQVGAAIWPQKVAAIQPQDGRGHPASE